MMVSSISSICVCYPDTYINTQVSFIYFVLNKAIISIGLAACNVAKPETFFNGTSLYDNIIKNSFEGTTGEVAYLDTGSRVPTSAIYSMNNFRATPPVNGTITFMPTRTSVFQDGAWVQEANEKFIYNGGGTQAPVSKAIVPVEKNYIGTGLRAAGLFLCSIVLALSFGFASWSKYKFCHHTICLIYQKSNIPICLYSQIL